MPFLEFDGKILTESKAILCYVAKELSKYIIQVDTHALVATVTSC